MASPSPTGQDSHEATHIIHTPAAMFRGWMVTQLKRPEMAQAWKRDRSRNQQRGRDRACREGPPADPFRHPTLASAHSTYKSPLCHPRQGRPM